MSELAIEHLSFSYESEWVLRDLNLRIAPGDFICILGESGCGKSTFLRLLSGLSHPTSGKIFMNGQEVQGAGLDRGIVFQDYSLFPWLTTGANILLALRQRFPDKSREELILLVEEWLVKVGLDTSAFSKYPFELSGGMRQRCAICRAFALDPPVLLMDEPFGALDAVTRVKLQRLILSLWEKDCQNRKTIVFVTHDVEEALLLGSKIILFGSSPKGIIYSHFFGEGEKPSYDEMFDHPGIISLRTELMHHLNMDIRNRL
jgi:ABC-type nitrate/sulfonate/bicarbonate transport system, ATPase component